MAEFFPGMTSRISGIGLIGIQQKIVDVHAKGWLQGTDILPIGGFYKARRSGEKHAWEAQTMHMLQTACDRASYDIWKQYSAKLQSASPIALRDLMDFKAVSKPIPVEEVESITSIRKRFVTPGMSLGALSPEAHKTLNCSTTSTRAACVCPWWRNFVYCCATSVRTRKRLTKLKRSDG